MKFNYYRQLNAMDCGPTCLRMIARYYGRHYNSQTLRKYAGFSKQGVSLLGISESAEKIGLRSRGVRINSQQLQQATLPCILHWNQVHFVVLVQISGNKYKIADPAKGMVCFSRKEFLQHWGAAITAGEEPVGVALLLEPTPHFYQAEGETEQSLSWQLVFQYLIRYRGRLVQVFISLLLSSLLHLIVPFLTQSMMDNGINMQQPDYVVIVLLAQLMLTFSQTVIGFIRGRIMMRISNLLNLQILSDFWIKLMKLPVAYFDIHHTGDTLQRLGDHKKIQSFLTGTALSTFFSIFNFIIYAVVLIAYSVLLFGVFIGGSLLYFGWVQIFLRVRRKINYESFHISAKENNMTLQLIQGMQEIRLNNAEKQKRWEWENMQATMFKMNFRNLNYNQWQTAGALFINQLQNILISFIVAKLVIDGKLTLGAMLAVQYIIGQLSGPISQWVGFIQDAQDAKISMERLNEVHRLSDEQLPQKHYQSQLPAQKSIHIENLTFTYTGPGNEPVLKDVNLHIPEGKVTAIVGASGSGKTTLLKILLKVYEQYDGKIRIGNKGVLFDAVDHAYWRSACGTVMQDGYIFNDTIARNIAVGQEEIEYDRLISSCRIANIDSFIESLPNGFYTLLGADGVGLSQGQKQRILIARAVYKNPEFLFFDEATNALDAHNEREIVNNLEQFFNGRTVVIVAHRLSTVKSADKIIVLAKGKIVEEGTHHHLTALKGSYYELVKNQLELGV